MARRSSARGLGPLEAEIEVAAPVDRVWDVVADLRSMGSRSPETVRMFGVDDPRPGSRGVSVNRRGAVLWPTTTRITRWKPPTHDGTAALAFHVWPTDVEWSYELTATAAGTRVVERRSGLAEPSAVVRHTARWLMGGAENHDVELLEGMRATLLAVKADAEATSSPR